VRNTKQGKGEEDSEDDPEEVGDSDDGTVPDYIVLVSVVAGVC